MKTNARLRLPLALAWAVVGRAMITFVALLLRMGDRHVSVYLRGSAAYGETRPWFSDIDVVAVLAGDSTGRTVERWKAVCRHLPLDRIVSLAVWRAADVDAAARATAFTYKPSPSERFPASAASPVLIRPGLYGPGVGWRPIGGKDARPVAVSWVESEREVIAWGEVQVWWRYVFRVLNDERSTYEFDYFWLKLIAEHARVLLWCEHSLSLGSRSDVLQAAVRYFPADEVLPKALDAWESRGASRFSVDASEVLTWSLSAAKRIAEGLGKGSDGLPTTAHLERGNPADLLPGEGDRELLPLADWHARVLVRPFDDSFLLTPGDPTNPDFLARCAREGDEGPFRAIEYEGLLLFPTTRYERAIYRSIQCSVSDPVSFALLEGKQEALFCPAPGWSARDSARRSVEEHARWLHAGARPSLLTLGKLIGAARAAAFEASFNGSRIRLPLTRAALAQAPWFHLDSIEEAVAAYISGMVEGKSVPRQLVLKLREELLRHPAYSIGTKDLSGSRFNPD